MLPDKEYLRVLEHGKNLGRLEVVKELERRLELLSQEKGIGNKTMEKVYRSLEVQFDTTNK